MKTLENPANAAALFQNSSDSLILSCLQGVMGVIYADREVDPKTAVAYLGAFAFPAGCADPEALMQLFGETEKLVILIPPDQAWAEAIQQAFGKKARASVRYGIRKEPGIFDCNHLKQLAGTLKPGFTVRRIDRELFDWCNAHDWSRDFTAQYPDYESYRAYGLGVMILDGEQPVAGASSYSGYEGGIEVEIVTMETYRRKGLALVCGAELLLACEEKGLYANWDAANEWSLRIAEKLGYHADAPYLSYRIGETHETH